ncbi:hypothetical protein OCV73_05990 [Barnesiella propionica]|uniref:hypothetical protein n=1 Tax=Barnesiella propionica TaxID=2981781 RepID=UPI0021D2CF0D|nr:hypothetical protein [Barnesiella propionica]MCU6768498.1 hypothetical protein [Barnesiella propionica]
MSDAMIEFPKRYNNTSWNAPMKCTGNNIQKGIPGFLQVNNNIMYTESGSNRYATVKAGDSGSVTLRNMLGVTITRTKMMKMTGCVKTE